MRGGGIPAFVIRTVGLRNGAEGTFSIWGVGGTPSLVNHQIRVPTLYVVSQMGSETRRYIHTLEACLLMVSEAGADIAAEVRLGLGEENGSGGGERKKMSGAVGCLGA